MSENVSEIIEYHHCFSQVSPYHIVSENRPVEGAISVRRVHAGFDLEGVALILDIDLKLREQPFVADEVSIR